ncbi:MAG: DUF898 domain-containing protein [Bacteroidetes bacterium]|nr:DUF898 domain-containing protein [Bacteroidota bacterium]MBP6316404.1 DUF898 domain-containing protein [Chitinophagaceae bacterium]
MENKTYSLRSIGQGSELFKIWIVNLLLQIVTLGLYYPWGKANQLKYLYENTLFEEDPFQFTGTGKEMFIGFIKALLFLILIYGIFFLTAYAGFPIIGATIFFLCFTAIIPLMIHGAYRYRMSRTSWRGIRFGYRGDRKQLYWLFIKGILLTLVTFGIYGSWFVIELRNYVISNIKIGNGKFQYRGNGTDFFVLNLVGYLLTIVTLGIYGFWWQKNLFAYYIDNMTIENDGEAIRFKSKATAGGFFSLLVVNVLLIIFTIGLATPWVVMRTLQFIFNNIELEGNLDLNKLVQTEDSYTDATAEDLADFFDFDVII